MKLLILISLLFSSTLAGAISIEELAEHPQWLKLMHYNKRLMVFHYVSELDGPEFFLSKNGKYDPLGELKANIEGMKNDNLQIGQFKQHPQCAFPARYAFLKKHLGLKYEEPECKKLNDYLKKFAADSVTLVFSTAYASNPGSMFGHTFLRINSKKEKGRKTLLDNGLSFAAAVPPDSGGGVLYATFGLFGGYRGQFTLLPYYAKVNEYNNAESRDLWEYELDLNSKETLTLLKHAWELETTSYFKYYFFDENCAYHLLYLIEIAKPEWKLTSYDWFVLPVDTVKILTEVPNAVKKVSFRPSLRKKLYQHVEAFSPQQKELFYKIIKSEDASLIASIEDSFILDTLALYFSYRKKEEKQLTQLESQKFDQLLRRRSQLPTTNLEKINLPKISDANRPELGHGMYKFGIAAGGADFNKEDFDTSFYEFHFKFSNHDLLNRDIGYENFSQLNLTNFTLRTVEDGKDLELKKVEMFSVISLNPVTSLETPKSWHVGLDHRKADNVNCEFDCYVTRLQTGSGYTFNLWKEHWIAYTFASLYSELGPELPRGYLLGPQFTLATIFAPTDWYKSHLAVKSIVRAFPEKFSYVQSDIEWSHSFFPKQNWDIQLALHIFRADDSTYRDFQQAKISFNVYH